MERCKDKNIRLNVDKLELKRREIPFIGHQLTANRLKPDPRKVEAILQMPKPTDIQGVQRLVGMATYLSKFLKGLSDICDPMRQLTKKDYKRLQRMLLALQKYEYNIVYKKGTQMYLADTLSHAYLPDCGNPEVENTDILTVEDLPPVEQEVQHLHMAEYLPISEARRLEIQRETQLDATLRVVKSVIQTGWQEDKIDVLNLATPYFHVRDELSVQDGLIFRGSRCVIPKSLRPDILKRLHGSHTGIESCRRRARELLYWPNMNAEISGFVSQCEVCSTYSTKQTKETLISRDIPDRPWSKLGTDMFSYDQKDYLVTVDYFSDYFEVDQITDKTGREVIHKLKSHLARHGIPDTIVSDNGPPYNSKDFADFAAKYEFDHVTSSPGHAQSNGKVEAAVKSAKGLVKKAAKSGSDPYLALLDHRNTPTEGTHSSPVQRLFNRRTKTLIPTSRPLLQPTVR